MSSFKEDRIRKITNLYYSNIEIQKAIHEFSKNREICPRYFEGFGKRPDSLQYPGDVGEMAKKGATSFHCSEELWNDPMKIETGMNDLQLNEIRTGWDFLIDIDCKWFDYSKKAAQAIIKVFQDHGIENIGIKYSGSKGFHIIVPWKAFPKEFAGQKTKDLFPGLPRQLLAYLRFKSEKEMQESLPEDFYDQFKNTEIKKGIKCNNCREVAFQYESTNYICPKCRRRELKKISPGEKKEFKCPDCRTIFDISDSKEVYECRDCGLNSTSDPNNFSKSIEIDLFELMGLDLIMVSPRHMFRMPYSLHEKTSLSSVVIDKNKIEEFDLKDADPLKVKTKNFMPECQEAEAKKFVAEAMDWIRENKIKVAGQETKIKGKYADFKPIILKNIENANFPPSIQKLLEGIADGKKRALFVLINLFRSIGMDKEKLEAKLYAWNKKNKLPLKEGYIKTQLIWSYRRKPIMPPNFENNYYENLGLQLTEEERRSKNPVTYTIRKNMGQNKRKRKIKE